MDPLLALLTLAGALGGVAGLGFGASRLARLFREEWSCSWEGHQVRLVAGQNRKELFVDGKSVARKTTLSGMGATLSHTFERDGRPPVVLTATVAHPDAKPVGRIYANGEWIGGHARQATLSRSIAQPPIEPTDARWEAARRLLADLRATAEPRASEAATRLEEGLRDVLGRLDRLGAARDAHRALGGDDARVDRARARLDTQAQEMLEALREFHLVALAGGAAPSLDRVEDLLGRVAADAEVEETARARVAASRQLQR